MLSEDNIASTLMQKYRNLCSSSLTILEFMKIVNFGRAWAGNGCRTCFEFSCQSQISIPSLLRLLSKFNEFVRQQIRIVPQAHSQPAELPKLKLSRAWSGDSKLQRLLNHLLAESCENNFQDLISWVWFEKKTNCTRSLRKKSRIAVTKKKITRIQVRDHAPS